MGEEAIRVVKKSIEQSCRPRTQRNYIDNKHSVSISHDHRISIFIFIFNLYLRTHRLLRYLMENPNRALSPGHLLQVVWEYPPNTGDPDLVRAHVRNLRSKIEKNSDRRYIRTIHGVGYMISL